MIYVNRLLETEWGWSKNYMKFFEQGIKENGYDVVLYPERETIKNRDLLYWLKMYGLQAYQEIKKHKPECVLFLDPMQAVDIQMLELKCPTVLLLHVAKGFYADCLNVPMYDSYIEWLSTKVTKVLALSNYIGRSYGITTTPVYSFAEPFEDNKKEGYVAWAGALKYRNFEEFKQIVLEMPDVRFRVFTQDVVDKFAPNVEVYNRLTSEEYKERIKGANVILSTAKHETFGYGIMEAVSRGAFPLVPNRACYPEIYSREFFYCSREEAKLKIRVFLEEKDKEGLRELCDKYSPKKIVKKIMEECVC